MSAVDDGDSAMRSDSEPDLDDVEGSNFHDVANFHITNTNNTEGSLNHLNSMNPADLELSPPASQASNNSPTQATTASTTRRVGWPDRDPPAFRMLRSNGGMYSEDSGQRGLSRHGLRGGKNMSMLDPVKLDGHIREPKKNVPGSAWMNNRAQEEYATALEKLQDPLWSMREFDDFFDERDMIIHPKTT
ncbi:hypothetical protein FGG08_002879 [Glutinoglossum americanum]|uniref:Uncharacterized protein n=1 Tax=Glutinoglossum americanum TaxID=1670608 RepID=A0A9P8I5F9_9PEZI|nr:hypothetical protein FGG08_002879 [Glutinoglossum americanum]